MLMAWYSGWYNGLAKKHFYHGPRAKQLEHEVILYCKANLGIRIIDAMAVIFKDERMRHGIQLKPESTHSPSRETEHASELTVRPRPQPPHPALGSGRRTRGHRALVPHRHRHKARPAAVLERRRDEAIDHRFSSRA